MEFFLPSVFILLLASLVVFFVFPRFGPSVLAAVSLVLLIMGVYQHYHTFRTEYRLSTWQNSFIPYASYILIGGLIFAILVYLLYLLPANSTAAAANAPIVALPSIANMPSANTATNPVTAGLNKALNVVGNVANMSNKRNNRGGVPFSQV
jgi:hypothetical protein